MSQPVIASVAFWAPVRLALVGDDDKPEVIQFRARYRRLKTSERIALDKGLAAGRIRATLEQQGKPVPDDLPASIDDKTFLDRLLLDWDLKDGLDKLIVYSEAERAARIEELDGLEAALINAYFETKRRQDKKEEIAKNSEAQSATT